MQGFPIEARESAEGFQASGYVGSRVGVDSSAAPVMAGVECIQQIHDLRTADLADDQAVRAHAESLTDQITQRDLARALNVRWASLEAYDVGMVRPQLTG